MGTTRASAVQRVFDGGAARVADKRFLADSAIVDNVVHSSD